MIFSYYFIKIHVILFVFQAKRYIFATDKQLHYAIL